MKDKPKQEKKPLLLPLFFITDYKPKIITILLRFFRERAPHRIVASPWCHRRPSIHYRY